MISKILKTTDGKLKVSIPSTLEEITLGMLIGLDADLSEVQVIGVLSGLGEQLYNVRNIDDFQQFHEHVLSLTHQIQYVYQEQATIPKEVKLMGRTIPVMSNLSVEPAGAYLNCRDIIAEEINECQKFFGEEDWQLNFKPSLKSAARVLAQYFFCPATKKPYNEYEAEAFESEVVKLPITQALPIATFFFLNYPNLLKPKVSYYQVFKQQLRKKQALRSLKYSGTTIR